MAGGRIVVEADELRWSFARSSGPGGQNVNKRETKAVLRWRPGASPDLPPDVLRRLESLAAGRWTLEGEIVIASDVYRERERNIEECRRRLLELLERAAVPPRPRRPTRPGPAARRRRLETKKNRAGIKRGRGRVVDED